MKNLTICKKKFAASIEGLQRAYETNDAEWVEMELDSLKFWWDKIKYYQKYEQKEGK